MTTKAEKSNGKQKAQSALLAYGAHLGPPFAGAGPFDGTWSTFVYPGSPPCPGFWSAFRHYPLSGGLVAQLGAMPGTGAALCAQQVGFQYAFTAPLACEMVFNLTLNLGPVTRLSRGGTVSAWATLQLLRPADWSNVCPPEINYYVSSNTGITLCIRPQIEARQRYILVFGILPIVDNAGYQSYGEIIVNSANLEARYPYGVQSAQARRLDRADADQRIMAFVNPKGKQKVQEISIEQAAKFVTAEST